MLSQIRIKDIDGPYHRFLCIYISLSVAENGATIKTTFRRLGEDPRLIIEIVWNPSTDNLGFWVKVFSVNYIRVEFLSQVA